MQSICVHIYIIYMKKKWNIHTVNQPMMKIQGLTYSIAILHHYGKLKMIQSPSISCQNRNTSFTHLKKKITLFRNLLTKICLWRCYVMLKSFEIFYYFNRHRRSLWKTQASSSREVVQHISMKLEKWKMIFENTLDVFLY